MANATQTPAERVRLSLDVTQRIRALLDDLALRTEAHTITEVIRRALSLYDLVIEHQEEEGSLIFRHKDGTEETVRVL